MFSNNLLLLIFIKMMCHTHQAVKHGGHEKQEEGCSKIKIKKVIKDPAYFMLEIKIITEYCARLKVKYYKIKQNI